MVGQKRFHAVSVGGNGDPCEGMFGRKEPFEERMQEPGAKGNDANHSRCKDGCSHKCRRSFDQLDFKYRKSTKRGLRNVRKSVCKSLSVNKLRVCNVACMMQSL